MPHINEVDFVIQCLRRTDFITLGYYLPHYPIQTQLDYIYGALVAIKMSSGLGEIKNLVDLGNPHQKDREILPITLFLVANVADIFLGDQEFDDLLEGREHGIL